jgi:RpiR family carbohydrate utilization transcriptional regulator
VARLVLADPRAFAHLPVRELAVRAHVSKPTVVRFCRSMGYDGLADFKLKLAGSVSEGVPFIHRSVDADDKTSDVLVKVVDNAVAAFLQYRNAASTAIEQAAQAIAATWQTGKRIEFYGAGNSGIVAQDAQHKFFRLGVTSLATSDGHMQVMSATCWVRRLRGDHLQLGPHARPDGRGRHRARTAPPRSPSPPAARPGLGLPHPSGRRPPRRLRPLQPHGLAPAAPAHHRRAGHLRGAAHRPALQPALEQMKNNLRAKRYT